MKILQVGSFPINKAITQGGVESALFGITTELSKSDNVVLFDLPRREIKNDHKEIIHGLIIYRFSNNGRWNFNSFSRITSYIKLIKKENPEIIHLHTTSGFILILYLFLKIYNYRTILTIHGLAHEEKRKELHNEPSIKNLFKYVFQSITEFLIITCCPILIVDTNYVSERIATYRRQFKIMRMPKIVVIPQGVNQEFYSLEGKKKKYDLISIGTFTNRKGHFFLVDVIEKLNEIIPNITLAIIGSKCESTYFNELLGRIKKNDLEKCISLFPDLSFKETLEILDQSGIFVLHSQEESQGIALCEAMAAGKPIVSTKVGGIPDVIEHGINGLLSEYGEVDIFTNNILTILTNKKYYESIALNNRTKSLKYKWDTIANDILDTYNQII